MSIQEISSLAGLISLGITLFVAIIGGFYMAKSGVGKQTNEAQESAISAMQAEITILRTRIDDTNKTNKRLELIIDTICAALEKRGIIITIAGEMITIEVEDGKKSTTIRIDEAQSHK